MNKELSGLGLLTQVEGETNYFENTSNMHFNEQMDRENQGGLRVEPSINSVEDRGKRIVEAQRQQDKKFASMINKGDGLTNFRFVQRAKNILSPVAVQAGRFERDNDYKERKRQMKRMGSNITLNSNLRSNG